MKKLDPGEYCEADHGYKGQANKLRLPFMAVNKSEIKRKGRARARHETINGFLRNFGSLKQTWRHPILTGQHKVMFEAAITITQIAIDTGTVKPFKCSAPYWE